MRGVSSIHEPPHLHGQSRMISSCIQIVQQRGFIGAELAAGKVAVCYRNRRIKNDVR